MRKIYLLLFLLSTSVAYAQQAFEVRGLITDTAGKPLPGVTIKLLYGRDSAQVITSATGGYSLPGINTSTFTIRATYSGLEAFSQQFTKTNANPVFNLTPITLAPAIGQMEGVVITSVQPVIVKEDTVQYDASAYKVREGAPVEDVIKKLPGVTVDKDGNIEAQGKKVARVRVNGKDFFGGDVQTATQNLPADMIANIQIIDDYGDQANVSGIKSGDPEKIININTQKNKTRGNFGNATVAGGTQGRYAANVFGNNFKDDRQISLLGAINNTNANLFNFNGGGRGGGARGANFGSDGRAGPGGNGITLSKSIGLNYRNILGKKLTLYGSYSFSGRSTNIISSSFTQDISNPDSLRTTQRESNGYNHNDNHRFTWNMEYAMDSLNYFKVSPYFSYSSSNNNNHSFSTIISPKHFSQSNNYSTNSSTSPGYGGNFLFNHKFTRRGRNFSVNLNVDYSDNNNDRNLNNKYFDVDSTRPVVVGKDSMQVQDINTRSSNTRTTAHLSYAEPLNRLATTYLELNYDWNQSVTESIRDVTDLMDSTGKINRFNVGQSNHYDYTFTTNRAGISLKGRTAKYNYSIGVLTQPSHLSGQSVGKNIPATSYTNVNWVPSARFVYNFARNNSLTATIDGSAREPNFLQLQPVADSTDRYNIVIGNPNLRNEFTNTFAIRYNKFDQKAGSSLFANFSYDRTNDKIVSNRFNTTGTRRTTSYLNTDGFEGYNGNASYTKPFSNRKYTAGVSMAGSYDNNISFTNNQKNKGSNWNLRPGANFRLDIENKVDITLRGDYTAYQTTIRYVDAPTYINKAQTLNLGVNGKNYFKDLTIGYDFSKLVNYGFNSSVATNPTILNVYTEYRFLKGKAMTVRLQGFDLFNNNTGITRTVTDNMIVDSRTVRLARYFLLSANIRLAKFAGGVNRGNRGNGGEAPGGGNRQGGGQNRGGGARF